MENGNELEHRTTDGLEELAKIELADIISTANEHGFSASEVLDALSAAIEASRKALKEDPDPAEDPEPMLGAEQGFDPTK